MSFLCVCLIFRSMCLQCSDKQVLRYRLKLILCLPLARLLCQTNYALASCQYK